MKTIVNISNVTDESGLDFFSNPAVTLIEPDSTRTSTEYHRCGYFSGDWRICCGMLVCRRGCTCRTCDCCSSVYTCCCGYFGDPPANCCRCR